MVFPLLTVFFMAPLLHRDLLWVRLRVSGLILPELLVEVGQLFVKLVPGLGKFVEARPALGIDGTMAWCRLRVDGAARG
jgi:hypothetical protein